MDYMFLLCAEQSAQPLAPDERSERMKRQYVIMDDAKARGIFKQASPLQPAATAKTVRHVGGNLVTKDGPFAETKEILGGFYILDCSDDAEAQQWASRIAQTGCASCVEFRALMPIPARATEDTTEVVHA